MGGEEVGEETGEREAGCKREQRSDLGDLSLRPPGPDRGIPLTFYPPTLGGGNTVREGEGSRGSFSAVLSGEVLGGGEKRGRG